MKKAIFIGIVLFLYALTQIDFRGSEHHPDYVRGSEAWSSRDYKDAFEWFKKAAEDGDLLSLNNLGVMYEDGLGVERDKQKAFEYYEAAATQGLDVAQSNLADLYVFGSGIEKDYVMAALWYRKAADQGNERAERLLKSLCRENNNNLGDPCQ